MIKSTAASCCEIMSAVLKRKPVASTGYQEAVSAHMKGWSVVPVNPATKVPKVSWGQYQQHQPTTEQVSKWVRHDAFALITGSCSGVVVLDIDPGGDEAIKGLELPLTVAASTPRQGTHYYYKHPGQRVKSTTHILGPDSCVDIRGDAGIVLLPDGDQRQWFPGLTPDDVEIAEMPDWLLELTCPTSLIYNNKISYKKRDKDFNLSNNITSRNSLYIPTKAETDKAPVSISSIIGTKLADWYKSDMFIRKAIPLLNIPQHNIGVAFCCVLPGHEECSPSASLCRHESGATFYRDWHCKSGIEWLTLGEVFAAQHYREVRSLAAPEQAVWQLRMLVQCELVRPEAVSPCKLPDGLAASTIQLYEGFLFLLACKWLHTPDHSTVFAKGFACAWSQTSTSLFRDSLLELIDVGAIVKAGKHGNSNLYLPGASK